jgi:hypothetical protein
MGTNIENNKILNDRMKQEKDPSPATYIPTTPTKI